MIATVTITSQGQISIPAKFRKQLGLKTSSQAIIELKDEVLTIKPAKDFFALKGALSDRAIKNLPIDKVIELENQAITDHIIDTYKNENSLS